MKNTIKITILAFVLTLTANVAFGQQPLWAYNRDQGVKQLAAKNYAEAVKSFTECIDDNEKADQCYSGRGKAYDALGKFTEAADDFSAALKINPENQQAIEGLANKKSNSQKPKEKAKDDDEYTPNSTVGETALLLGETLNGKFDFMENKRLVYVVTMKKSNETFRYRIEFVYDDSDKFAFKWNDTNNNKNSEKMVITYKAFASASKYVNIFTSKSALSPDTEITFVLSQTLYKYLKADQEISLDLGNGMQKLSFKDKFTPPSGVYTNKNVKKLHFQTADEQTKIQILDDPICPLIVGIETPEYTLTLVKG